MRGPRTYIWGEFDNLRPQPCPETRARQTCNRNLPHNYHHHLSFDCQYQLVKMLYIQVNRRTLGRVTKPVAQLEEELETTDDPHAFFESKVLRHCLLLSACRPMKQAHLEIKQSTASSSLYDHMLYSGSPKSEKRSSLPSNIAPI